MPEETSKPSVSYRSKFYIFVILGILLFISGGILAGFIIKNKPEVLGLSTQSEITSLVSKIEKLIVLPSNESPTLTTIGDTSELNKDPFFKNAKTGDKLLAYTNTKWAVLYRPSENRIIEVGILDTNKETPTPSPTIIATPEPTITPTPVPSESPSPTPPTSPSPSA